MTKALRDMRNQGVLLTVLAISGIAWWLLLAGPSTSRIFICGVDGFGPVGGAWSGERLVGLCGMWVVMAGAMMLPAAALVSVRQNASGGDLGENPSPTPPHKGEGLSLPHPQCPNLGKRPPRVFSPLVGEMAGRPEGVLVGYLTFLIAMSTFAAISQWMLESIGVIGEGAKIASPVVAGVLLAGIGAWHIGQFLRKQKPCGSHNATGGPALVQGWRHGCSSFGCCLTMVGLQFAGGAMNIGLMIGLTLWMMAESILPWRRELASATGIALLTAGCLTIASVIA